MAYSFGMYPYGGNPYGFQPAAPGGMQQFNQQFGQQAQDRGQSGDSRIWVQGEVGAKAYLVAPGNTVELWDSEQPVIWLKSVLANGVPSMTRINYTIDTPAAPATAADKPKEEYVTRAEFEKRIAEIEKADKAEKRKMEASYEYE